jgi:MFS family permease
VALSAAGFGLSWLAFAASRAFWLSAVLLALVGFTMMLETGSSNTLIQSMSPDHLRGRVMAVYSMMFMGMAPIGALLAGLIAAPLGAPGAVALGGIVCLAAAGLFGVFLPHLRTGARTLIVANGLAGGDPAQEVTTAGIAVESEDSGPA